MEPLKIESLMEIPMQFFFILLCFAVELVLLPCNLLRSLLTLFIEGILKPLDRASRRLHAKMRGQIRDYVTE